jgi:hypothetical protein
MIVFTWISHTFAQKCYLETSKYVTQRLCVGQISVPHLEDEWLQVAYSINIIIIWTPVDIFIDTAVLYITYTFLHVISSVVWRVPEG